MISNELQTRLRRAADLLEALAGDAPEQDEPEYATAAGGLDADEYVDPAAGQTGVAGGVREVDVATGTRLGLRAAALREAATIRQLLTTNGRTRAGAAAVPAREGLSGQETGVTATHERKAARRSWLDKQPELP